ncbi:MAG: IclR family transcriptional regulator [Firmicutes bacterium]|nr:IclR family transcriptional regulator [Bacillota bacterium]
MNISLHYEHLGEIKVAEKVISIIKVSKVLKRLAKEPYEMTALELSNELNINRSTIHRILNTLISEMMVLKNPSNKKYKIGPTLYHMGSAYLYRQDNSEQIKHILDCIAKETKQSVGYSILAGEKILNIYEIESYQPIKIGYRQGSYYPIHCGVYGKCIMAYLKPKERLKEIVYSNKLIKKTNKTITDPKELLTEYERIRKSGYAISDEESLEGAIGIGAPVKDSNENIIGCVGAAGIKSSLSSKDLEFLKSKVILGAKEISKLMP